MLHFVHSLDVQRVLKLNSTISVNNASKNRQARSLSLTLSLGCSYFVKKPLTISAISCKVFTVSSASASVESLLRSHQAWKLRWLSSNYFQQLFASASLKAADQRADCITRHTDTGTTTSIRRLSWCLCNKRQQQQQLRRRMRNCCCVFEHDEKGGRRVRGCSWGLLQHYPLATLLNLRK